MPHVIGQDVAVRLWLGDPRAVAELYRSIAIVNKQSGDD